MYSNEIYGSWEKKQLQKYEQVWPKIRGYLNKQMSVLDIGIGRSWFEKFFLSKKFRPKRIVGVDLNTESVQAGLPEVAYHFTDNFATEEKFEFVICFDALHLVENEYLEKFISKYALISVPKRFKKRLDYFRKFKVLEEGEIGSDERDHFLFIEK